MKDKAYDVWVRLTPEQVAWLAKTNGTLSYTESEIGEELGISGETARTHIQNILNRTHSRNITEACVNFTIERMAEEAHEQLLHAINGAMTETEQTHRTTVVVPQGAGI